MDAGQAARVVVVIDAERSARVFEASKTERNILRTGEPDRAANS
jgi:hypothetical protein